MKSSALLSIVEKSLSLPNENDAIKRTKAMTMARTVVAKVESTLEIPILPKIATNAAEIAERSANIIQVIFNILAHPACLKIVFNTRFGPYIDIINFV